MRALRIYSKKVTSVHKLPDLCINSFLGVKIAKNKRFLTQRYLSLNGGKRDMTYILGARCSDGVVLVGDTKVTIEGGADYAYSKKISTPLTTVVMGSSGIGGLYKDFQNRIISRVLDIERDRKERGLTESIITNDEQFSVLVSNVIREMHEIYDDDRHLIVNNLMIIGVTRIGSGEAQLTTYNPYGFPEPVNKYRAIGHGEPYGSLFLKKLWNPKMTMEEVAKLGVFIIKFIDYMHLDNSVGFSEEYPPQVVYIPHVPMLEVNENLSKEERQKAIESQFEKYKIRELSVDETKHFMNEVSSKVADFENFFKRGQFRI